MNWTIAVLKSKIKGTKCKDKSKLSMYLIFLLFQHNVMSEIEKLNLRHSVVEARHARPLTVAEVVERHVLN